MAGFYGKLSACDVYTFRPDAGHDTGPSPAPQTNSRGECGAFRSEDAVPERTEFSLRAWGPSLRAGMPSGERALLPSAARAEVTSRPPDGPFLTILVALRWLWTSGAIETPFAKVAV